VSKEQQPPPLDQKRVKLYVDQFKVPITSQLSNFSQFIPNTIDQLITQCVTLEMQITELQKINEKLLPEKTLAKTIIKDKENKPSK